MKCYRYFKEARNCNIHHGGRANDKAVLRYNEFSNAVHSPGDLGMPADKEIPHHYPLVEGEEVRLSLRGVVGFGDVIERIFTTLDATFLTINTAEQEIIRRWEKVHGTKSFKLKADPQQRRARIVQIVQQLGFGRLAGYTLFDTFLKNQNYIRF